MAKSQKRCLSVKFLSALQWDANLTLSRNRIKDFVEYSTYYDENWNEEYKGKELGNTHISYSPEVVGSSMLHWALIKGGGINVISKYVGDQYFDNTSSRERMIDSYFVHNLRFDYTVSPSWIKEIVFQLQVNNLFDLKYENNAYGDHWYYQNREETWKAYFPQAGINFLAGIILRF